MRARQISIALAALAAWTMPATAAAVNCNQVNQYLGTGRSVQDIAETMIIPEEEVKKCQQQGAGAATGSPPSSPTPGTGGATKAK